MKREKRKPLTLAMTPEGERVRMLRAAAAVPDFTPPPSPPLAEAPRPLPSRAKPAAAYDTAPAGAQPAPAPREPTGIGPARAARTADEGPVGGRVYWVAAAAAVLWAGTLAAFVAGYEGRGWAFDYRPFRWAVAAGLALMPMGFIAALAYAVRQGARLAFEARLARTLAGELSVPAVLAAGRTGDAMADVRAEIDRAAQTAEDAGRRLAELSAALVEEHRAVAQAAEAAERSARALGGGLQAERLELAALGEALGARAQSVSEGLARQADQLDVTSQDVRARLAEVELGLATRTAELITAAAEAGRAAEGAGGALAHQNDRLQALTVELREERDDLARTGDALMVDEEALARRIEDRRARLLEVAESGREDAAALVAAAAEGAETLRALVSGAAGRLREMTEAARVEEEALDARARERTSHYLSLVAEERAALEGDARQALARLAEAAEAARSGAAEGVAESAAALEAAALAAVEAVRRRADELAEAAFAAGQRADQAFDSRIASARRAIDASAGVVEEAGVRAAARIEQGLEGARSAMDEIGRLLVELEGRLDQAPRVAQSRATALKQAVEQGSAELAAAARLAAEETQAIDAAFQARAKANYAALGEAARRMGALAMPAPPSPPSAPAPPAPPALAPTIARPAKPPPEAPAPEPARTPPPPPPSPTGSSTELRPRLRLTPTQEDSALRALFEPAAASTPPVHLNGSGAGAGAVGARQDSWSWKDLLSTLDDDGALDDDAVSDRMIEEIEALGVDSAALLPPDRTEALAEALARGEDESAREAVRRLAPAALRRLSRRVRTDRALRDQVESHRERFGARVSAAVRSDLPAAAALLASDPGRAWLLLEAAADAP